jgi:hypothetical protein
MLSWEYPPGSWAGWAVTSPRWRGPGAPGPRGARRHARPPDAPAEEWLEGVHVVRVPEAPPVIPFDGPRPVGAGVQQPGAGRRDAGARGARRRRRPRARLAGRLRRRRAQGAFDLPIVATIHATEYGRHQGWLPGPMNKLIHQIEWWLTYEARRVIACSEYMREQVGDIFQLPDDGHRRGPNAVARRDFALPDDEVAAFRATGHRRRREAGAVRRSARVREGRADRPAGARAGPRDGRADGVLHRRGRDLLGRAQAHGRRARARRPRPSPASSRTTTCGCTTRPPTSPSPRRSTSRSGWSRSRRWRAGRRWSSATPAGCARSCPAGTA